MNWTAFGFAIVAATSMAARVAASESAPDPSSISAVTKVYVTYAASDDVERPLPHGVKVDLSTSNVTCKSKSTCTLLLSATEQIGNCYFPGKLWGMLVLLDGKKVLGRNVGLTVGSGQQVSGTLQGVVANVLPGTHQLVLQSISQVDCTEYYFAAAWSVGRP